MSILIDELIRKETGHTVNTYITRNTIQFPDKDQNRYSAKALKINSFKEKLKRVYDAFRILKGTSIAVHYKEDENV